MSDSVWIRKATSFEQEAYSLYRHSKCFVIRSTGRITTSREVTNEEARNVFTSLYRKTPSLRTHLREKDGELWLRYNSEERIDFEAIENADIEQVARELPSYDFHPDGPFWAVKWLPWSSQHSEYVQKTKLSISDDADDRKYTYHFVMAFHHGITDGYSCVQIVRNALIFLDSLIAGSNISDEEQVSSLLYIDEDLKAMKEKEIAFVENKDLYKECVKSYENVLVDNLVEFRKPHKRRMESVPLLTIYDKETTTKFLNRCKQNGVSVNSGFTAVIKAAFVQFLSNNGVMQNEYSVPSLHVVNLRSYFLQHKKAFGFYVGDLHINADVPINVLDDFWSFAKSIQLSFKEKYGRCTPLENIILKRQTGFSPLQPISAAENASNGKLVPFLASNMMDMTSVVRNIGEHVRIEFLDWITSLHVIKAIWQSAFYTIYGQLIHSLQYNAFMIDESSVQELSDEISKVLRAVSE